MAYIVGDLIRARTTIRDPDTGDLVDPTTVTVHVEGPDDTVITGIAVTKEATGRYLALIEPTAPGTWTWWFDTTGTYQSSESTSVKVGPGHA